MKTESPQLSSHRQQETTTLAWCWKVVRTDGEMFGFTSVDTTFEYDGLIYFAATGIQPSAAQGGSDLAVRNMEVKGVLVSDLITEEDVLAGVWDNAEVEIFEVNYLDLSQGRMIIGTGTTGEVQVGRTTYTTEVRGLAQPLQQSIGETVGPGCQAIFGDARCKVDVEALRQSFTVTSVASSRQFVASGLTGSDDEFGAGEVTWVTGGNATYRMEVNRSTLSPATTIVLSLPMVKPIQVGDTGTVIPGCRKRATEDCINRYDNIINFRGFPFVPGNSRVLGAGGLVGGQ